MNKIVLVPLIIIIMVYVVVTQIIPASKEISTLKETIEANDAELNKIAKQKAQIKQFSSSLAAHQSEQDFVNQFIPRDPLEDDIINTVSQIAEDDGLALFVVDFSDKVAKTSRSKTDVKKISASASEGSIMVSGSYDNIKLFLNKLFLIKRLYTFDTLNIEKIVSKDKSGETTSQDSLNVNIVFDYSYIPSSLPIVPSDIEGGIKVDYNLINTVDQKTTEVDELVLPETNRPNPFMP